MTLRLRAYLSLVTVIGLTYLPSAAMAHPNGWDTWKQYRDAHIELIEQPEVTPDKALHGSTRIEWERYLKQQVRLVRLRERWRQFDLAYWESLQIVEPVGTEAVSYGDSSLCGAACVQCESGGDPNALSSSGKYWGKYQYDYESWKADGGDPGSYGSASESEQDAVAANAPFDRWPSC